MIKYLQTHQQFDAARMQAEVQQLSTARWATHYNTKHYEGDWSIIPLRSINGDSNNAIAIHATSASYRDTVLLDQCPYIKEVISAFACEKTSIRLMKLDAGAIIKEHTDHDMNMEAGEARFHIPVQTNSEVAFYIMEERIPMQEGQCWYLNLSLPHRVTNAGSTDRIHLVMDCLVNDWAKELLSSPGICRKEVSPEELKPRHSAEDKKRIIAELRRQNTNLSLQMADQMEAEI